MSKTPKKSKQIRDVKPLTFKNSTISLDDEQLIFQVTDRAGKEAHISIDWSALGRTWALFQQAAEKAAAARKKLGKSDVHQGDREIEAQVVRSFQVNNYVDQKIKLLSLHSPSGLRFDFAVPTNKHDQLRRPLHKAVAEELARDPGSEPTH